MAKRKERGATGDDERERETQEKERKNADEDMGEAEEAEGGSSGSGGGLPQRSYTSYLVVVCRSCPGTRQVQDIFIFSTESNPWSNPQQKGEETGIPGKFLVVLSKPGARRDTNHTLKNQKSKKYTK